jgi:hypothetical protein
MLAIIVVPTIIVHRDGFGATVPGRRQIRGKTGAIP